MPRYFPRSSTRETSRSSQIAVASSPGVFKEKKACALFLLIFQLEKPQKVLIIPLTIATSTLSALQNRIKSSTKKRYEIFGPCLENGLGVYTCLSTTLFIT
ncbi:hypothetical protein V6Z11_D08G093400 [Gossypium hirsutum]